MGIRPAGFSPLIGLHNPSALESDRAMLAVVLSGVHQAGGLRSGRWAFPEEIARGLRLRGEPDAAALISNPLLQALVARRYLEQRQTFEGFSYRRA